MELGRVQVQLPQVQPIILKGAVEGISLKAVVANRLARAERVESVAKPPVKNKDKKKGVPPAPDAPTTTLAPGPNQPPEALVFELAEPFEAKDGDETLDVSMMVTSNVKETIWRVLFTSAQVDQLVPESVLEIAEREPNKLTRDEQATLKRNSSSCARRRRSFAKESPS